MKREHWILLAVLTGVSLLQLVRVPSEASIWFDEMATLQLGLIPAEFLFERSAREFNPPLYQLIVRVAYFGLEGIGFEPAIGTLRSINVVAWIIAAFATFGLTRKLTGNPDTALLATLAVSCAAAVSHQVRELRCYAMVMGLAQVAFQLICVLDKFREDRRLQAMGWSAYAMIGAMLLWLHFLAAIIMALMGIAWLYLVARRGGWRTRFFVLGAVANMIALLSFLPWLRIAMSLLGAIVHEDRTWSTEPNVRNLTQTFALWIPWGPIGLTGWSSRIAALLGLVSFAVPVAFGVKSLRREDKMHVGQSVPYGWMAIGTAAAFVLATWLIDRCGIAPVFHGPRYPQMIVGILAWGLVMVVGNVARSIHWKCMAPWLIVSSIASLFDATAGHHEALGGIMRKPELYPPRGTPLYVMPKLMIPFVRKTFSDWDLRPASELDGETLRGKTVTVLDFVNLPSAAIPQDAARREAIRADRFARVRSSDRIGTPHHSDVWIHRLDGVGEANPSSEVKDGTGR